LKKDTEKLEKMDIKKIIFSLMLVTSFNFTQDSGMKEKERIKILKVTFDN
jgi:hypothetical protein